MPADIWNIANFFSLLRILLVPIFVWLALDESYQWAFWVFSIAALTDLLDGWLARHFKLVTPLGIILDPIGDKMLVLSGFLALAANKHIPSWMAAVAVGREVLVVSGIVLLAGFAHRNDIARDIRSTWFGKTGSLLVMAALVLNLAQHAGWLPAPWAGTLVWSLAFALFLNLLDSHG